MLPEKRVLGFVDASRKVAPVVEIGSGQRPTGMDDVGLGAGFKAKDLVGLLMRHWPARKATPPRCRIGLRVLTPTGAPAVKLRCQ
jgi:hypothetical protein